MTDAGTKRKPALGLILRATSQSYVMTVDVHGRRCITAIDKGDYDGRTLPYRE
jgi:hypothetical protein